MTHPFIPHRWFYGKIYFLDCSGQCPLKRSRGESGTSVVDAIYDGIPVTWYPNKTFQQIYVYLQAFQAHPLFSNVDKDDEPSAAPPNDDVSEGEGECELYYDEDRCFPRP